MLFKFCKKNPKTIALIVFVLLLCIVIIYTTMMNPRETFSNPTNEVKTQKEIDAAIKKYDYVLIKYHAPWCGYCKELSPIWQKIIKKFDEKTLKNDKTIKLISLDCEAHQRLAKKHKIGGFPTLKLFKKKKIIEYENKNTYFEISKFIKNLQ
jgi:protein disulfide-isomerase-like protein